MFYCHIKLMVSGRRVGLEGVSLRYLLSSPSFLPQSLHLCARIENYSKDLGIQYEGNWHVVFYFHATAQLGSSGQLYYEAGSNERTCGSNFVFVGCVFIAYIEIYQTKWRNTTIQYCQMIYCDAYIYVQFYFKHTTATVSLFYMFKCTMEN